MQFRTEGLSAFCILYPFVNTHSTVAMNRESHGHTQGAICSQPNQVRFIVNNTNQSMDNVYVSLL